MKIPLKWLIAILFLFAAAFLFWIGIRIFALNYVMGLLILSSCFMLGYCAYWHLKP